MTRCRISNPKKLKKISERIGKTVIKALTRGGTDHRIDCLCDNGECYHLYKDGDVKIMSWEVQ